MALLLCCPCGTPIDAENIDLIVEAECPRCHRELSLELEVGAGRYRRPILTVLEATERHWVGEKFIVPLGESLTLGTGSGIWLSLESGELAERHCSLRVSSKGYIVIEDLDTASGTWVGGARIAKGKLRAGEDFRIGEYRFRLDFKSALGTASGGTSDEDDEFAAALPEGEVARLHYSDSPLHKLVQNRFTLARRALKIFAGLALIYHVVMLRFHDTHPWELHYALLAGVIIFGSFVFSTRFVRVLHRTLRFIPIGLLIVLAIVDIAAWMAPLACVAALVMAAGMMLWINDSSEPTVAAIAAFVILTALGLIVVPTIGRIMPLLAGL